MTNLDIFSLDINSTVKSALKKIDSNKTGIAIIVDDSNRVLATLSDGDIRRFLIGGGSIHDHIKNCINTNFIKGRSLDDREKESKGFLLSLFSSDSSEVMNIKVDAGGETGESTLITIEDDVFNQIQNLASDEVLRGLYVKLR